MGDRLSEKQIDLAQYQTIYWEGGEAHTSTPILFLHGWTISTAPYHECLSLLSQRYRVIAPDLPGFGQCKYPKSVPDHIGYVNCLVAFLQALKVEKAHVIGHSGGGAVAAALAATMPSLVSSVIISDSTGIPLGALPTVVFRRLSGMVLQLPKVKPGVMLQFYRALLYNCVSKPQNIIQCTWIALEKDLRPLLPQIQSPTLILWGGNDRFIPLRFAKEFTQLIPEAQLIVAEGEYHEWAMFRPQKFVSIVFSFLQQFSNN